MSEIVFGVDFPGRLHVAREGGELRLRYVAYASNGDRVSTFSWPMRDEHLEVLRADPLRHVLLQTVLSARCRHWWEDDLTRTPDPSRVADALDHLLLTSDDDLVTWLGGTHWSREGFLRVCADEGLLDSGRVLAGLVAQGETDLDRAIVAFCGGTDAGPRQTRTPDAVPPEILPEVLHLMCTVEWRAAPSGIARRRRDVEEMVAGAFTSMWPDIGRDARRAVQRLVVAEHADMICEPPQHGRRRTRRGNCLRCLGEVSD